MLLFKASYNIVSAYIFLALVVPVGIKPLTVVAS